jgi:hypothetical protein
MTVIVNEGHEVGTIYYGYGTVVDGCTWNNWTSASIATNSTTNTVWCNWTISSNAIGITYPIENEEEARATVERIQSDISPEAIERAETERLERQKIIQESDARAEDLLLSVLNRRQRKEWKEKKQISIFERGYKHPHYILRNLSSSNVYEYDEKTGKRIFEHCVQTIGVPLADQLATQVLYLRNNPEELLRVANNFPVRESILH